MDTKNLEEDNMTRTPEEVRERFNRRSEKKEGMFDLFMEFEGNILFEHMNFEVTKDLLKEGTTEDEMKDCFEPCSKLKILEEMKDYMPFAWMKAKDGRGISANRSIEHYISWVWLLGDDDFCTKIEHEFDHNYHGYGKPILKMICDNYGWKIRQESEAERGYVIEEK